MGSVDMARSGRRGRAAGVSVALCVAGLGLLVSGTSAVAASAGTRPQAIPDDWPTFHQSDTHTGVSADTSVNTTTTPTLTKAWSSLVGKKASDIFASPAVVYNAKLHKTVVYDAGNNGYVDAFNAVNGDVIWKTALGGGAADSPAVYDGTLYVANDSGTLMALNATTGAKQCSVTLPVTAPEKKPPKVLASPAVADVNGDGPTVFFGDVGTGPPLEAGHEWAVAGYGNSQGNCKILWSFNDWHDKGKNQTGSWSPPAVTQTSTGQWLVVFGSANPDDSVYALHARTGTLAWRYQTATGGDTDVGAGPTITAPGVNGFSDGVVYVDGKDMVEYALDLATGAKIWSFDMHADTGAKTSSEESTASIHGNDLIVDYAHYLYEFNATTGAVIWRVSLPDSAPIEASPAVSGPDNQHVIFIGDIEGNEYGFKMQNGALLFTYSGKSPILSSAAVSDGRVFFGDNSGDVVALAPSSS